MEGCRKRGAQAGRGRAQRCRLPLAAHHRQGVGRTDEPNQLRCVRTHLRQTIRETNRRRPVRRLVPRRDGVGAGRARLIYRKAQDVCGLDIGAGHTAIEAATGVKAHPSPDYRRPSRIGEPERRIVDLVARQRNQASTTDRIGVALRGDARKQLGDASVDQLRRLGRVLGNDALAGKLAQNNQMRDLLLAVVRDHLSRIALAQNAELKALAERGAWWRRLRRGEPGVVRPEPARWAEPARLFREAAEAVCAGDLGRGADLIQQADERERAHRKATPKQVNLPKAPNTFGVERAAIAEVRDGEGCTPTTATDVVHMAALIENVTESADPAGRLANARHKGVWWEVEEEEEEAKATKEAAPRSRRLEEPAAREDLARRPAVAPVRPAAPVVEVQVGVEGPSSKSRTPRR